LSASGNRIADYDGTAGAVREHASALNRNQPGDPEKFARQVVDFAQAADPPVRMPFGRDTVAAIEAKHAADAEIIKRWREVSVSTDF
jgi:hypothetical protein